ncbi:hypothetical protein BCR41DRAFT_371419 [Lobosporangium transversale]|uniref:Uncharacterized protein n=1 Tax=Lobosporangium transversale TaxID=64571 RepID=A0A1Y2GL16_9FUNG|nr:hypothetical protein BCR41DRAFT_371419 [Lobosporangium transversale]ORZ13912.1 hypothetical protein BCR41DRAFT_371419 [Lobosporangium transversale]|eukprot:XP_021880696.1 hypothetical protein BCR41DRAFT_371419 [Lobosporangium transversale]
MKAHETHWGAVARGMPHVTSLETHLKCSQDLMCSTTQISMILSRIDTTAKATSRTSCFFSFSGLEDPPKPITEIFAYTGQHDAPTSIKDDHRLRNVLHVCKVHSKRILTISLESPRKSFSEWKFADVCHKYDLSINPDPDLPLLLPVLLFELKLSPLDTAERVQAFESLVKEVEDRAQTLLLVGSNESTRSLIVASFLVCATKLFKSDMYLACEKKSGRTPRKCASRLFCTYKIEYGFCSQCYRGEGGRL